MMVKREANLYSFGISRLTKNHQYDIRLRISLTQTLILPKLHVIRFQEKICKCQEKCTQSAFSMLKAITQTEPVRLNQRKQKG